MEELLQISDHDYVLFFMADGRVRSMKGYAVPLASRTAAGIPISQVCFFMSTQMFYIM